MIKLSVTISNQAYVFLCCVLGGMIIAFIYDVFRIRRKAIRTSNIIVYFEDFIYWILVALVLFAVVYISNEGELRGYLIVGAIIGIILYSLLLSKIVMTVFLFALKLIYKFLVTVSGIIMFPIKIIFKLLKFPARIINKYTRKAFAKARRVGRDKVSNFKVWRKRFRNIRKKI